MTTGIIAEKRSQADAIATAFDLRLANGCYEGNTDVLGHVTLVWARGHLFELQEPDAAKPGATWTDPATLLPLPTSPAPQLMKDAASSYKNIAAKLKGAARMVIATDPDREGEAIGRDILAAMKYNGPTARAWLTKGLDKKSIISSFESLRPGADTESIYAAQQARAVADWQYQFVTRAYTAAGRHGLLGDHLGTGSGRASVTSVGRVQSPTVRMIVERDRAIANFKPQDHFVVTIDCKQGDNVVTLKYAPVFTKEEVGEPTDGVVWRPKGNGQEPLFTNVEKAREFFVSLQSAPGATLSIARKRGQKTPPKPLALIDLQKAASKAAGISSARALELADKLYKDGVLSYPRTENQELPNNIYSECSEHLSMLSRLGYPGASDAEKLHAASDQKPRCYTSDPGEHHGLMPTTTPLSSSATKDEKQIYDLVCKRYIEAHLPHAQTSIVEITGSVDATDVLGRSPARFYAKGETVDDPGWMAPYRNYKSETLAPMADGHAEISSVDGKKEQTSPPDHFTEDTLLAAMKSASRFVDDKAEQKLLKEASGIGTPATRASVIETILARDYVVRKGKSLRATFKAVDLIDNLDDGLTSVAMTAQWEADLAEIEKLSPDDSRRARDKFIAAQTARISTFIDGIAKTMKSTPRKPGHGNQPGAGGASGGSAPTKKMLALAKKIAKERGERLPRGTAQSFDKCKAYLDEKLGQSASKKGVPTPKMIAAAERISQAHSIGLPDDYKTVFASCKSFLDKYAQASRSARR